ncbi:MAG TPA: thioredoxin domain-containing protein [Patescibacteria group bacterium]|nr:thioredoxin domain-containing protein [Patescibacteria group bacterium]
MTKQFWAVVVIVVLALIGVFAFTGNKSNNSGGSSKGQLTNHVEGQGKASVTLVEYGDYECPFCGQYYPTVKQIEQQYDQLIHFQFRNFPLTSLHPNALAGARAAEAADLQGKFWQMHDTLYENQDPNGKAGWVASSDPLNQYFVSFAQQLGLNVTQFKTDFASDKVNNLIQADLGEANKLGLTGTPTFFVDGKQVQISNTAGDFQKVLNAEITKKSPGTTLPAATPTTGSSGATSQSTQ